MRILLISHQLDYSGAPIALLELARSLQQLGHSITLASLRDGPLGKMFATGAPPSTLKQYLSSSAGERSADGRPPAPFDLYLANTALSVPLALKMAPSVDRVLAWIHESPRALGMLKLDPDRLGLRELRYAAFPARFQMAEYQEWMPDAQRFQLKNCVEMTSEEATPESGYYVCTGAWEPRKRQTWLLELLESVSPTPRIAFVGASRPHDVATGDHLFTGPIPPDEAKKMIAGSRGVISASELEVQSLSCIEAVLAGRPVLMSNIPAHLELKEYIPDVVLFDPADRASFRAGFRRLNEQWDDPQLRTRMQSDARHHFGRVAFNEAVKKILACFS